MILSKATDCFILFGLGWCLRGWRGTVAYRAAWDVFRGQVFGRVAPATFIATF